VVAPAPSYDPWTWLLWGREVASGTLRTEGGPAFKPLPVAVCALLAPLGGAAPVVWVILARAAALAAVALAFVLGRRLGGGRAVAGVLAAAGVALCGAYPTYAAAGDVTGAFLALALGGVLAWRAQRFRVALACGLGCALLRVEAWPFALAAATVLWRRRPQDRPVLVAVAALVPLAWLGPEWLGSGDPLRSGERARVPNPGQPALADVPALASLRAAAALALWPLLAGAGLLAWRERRAPSLAVGLVLGGLAWVALVAAMAQAGFSGEPRYALPGVALVAIGGAVGLVGAGPRAVGWGLAALVVVAALPRAVALPRVGTAQEYQWQLSRDLERAVLTAGGRDAVLRCGTPYVGPFRGPLMAYRLRVAKHRVQPDRAPSAPGFVFRSRLTRRADLAPEAPAFALHARAGVWEVRARCRPPRS